MTGLLALAFGAGLLAPVNPCGFGLLPAVLTALGPSGPGAPSQGLLARLAGGLRAGLALSFGFTTTFTVIGVGLALGIRSLITLVPWLAAGLGVTLAAIGLAILTGWHPPLRLPTRHPDLPVGPTGTVRMVGFGAGYAIASASCTLALLLAVVTQAAATNATGVLAVFTTYAAVSALLLVALALIAAAAGGVLARWLQRFARYATRTAGAVLAISGAYLLVYWLPQLLGTPAMTAGLAGLSGPIGGWITDHQLGVALTAAALILTTTLAVAAARRRARAPRYTERVLGAEANPVGETSRH